MPDDDRIQSPFVSPPGYRLVERPAALKLSSAWPADQRLLRRPQVWIGARALCRSVSKIMSANAGGPRAL